MSIDPEMERKLAKLKKQLEEITGKEIDASPEQLAIFAYPVGSAFYAFTDEESEVLWRRIIFPGTFCVAGQAPGGGRSILHSDRWEKRLSPKQFSLPRRAPIFRTGQLASNAACGEGLLHNHDT
jgi:hypothetical protein